VSERSAHLRGRTDRIKEKNPGYRRHNTALVIADPQNDFLSEAGVTWSWARDSVQENKTIPNIERLLKATKRHGFEGFI
jgi:hypothetical protein